MKQRVEYWKNIYRSTWKTNIDLSNENAALKAANDYLHKENIDIRKKYNDYLTGDCRLYYYHDIWCNANRKEPMGCSGCSCTIGKKLKKLQAENKLLRRDITRYKWEMANLC